jgi:NADP-dependent 3-hydroxy acid dehydrogenase YdfG
MALVTGASRGFGRAIAIAPAKHGAHVVGVARDRGRLEELHTQLGGTFTPVAADAADPVIAGQLLDTHRPRTLVLNAGATPLAGCGLRQPGGADPGPQIIDHRRIHRHRERLDAKP